MMWDVRLALNANHTRSARSNYTAIIVARSLVVVVVVAVVAAAESDVWMR